MSTTPSAIVRRWFSTSPRCPTWVTAAIALENAVKEAIEESRQVFLVGATGSTEKRLQKLKLLDRVPQSHITDDRLDALRLAVNGLQLNV